MSSNILASATKVTRVVNATAVGTTAVNGSTLDMQDFEGVMFICQFGTITDGAAAIKAQQGQASNMSDAADLLGTQVGTAITDDNKCVILDVYRPAERYVRGVVVRGGATGTVIDSVVAIQYGPKVKPTVHDATTVAATETWASPAEGTA